MSDDYFSFAYFIFTESSVLAPAPDDVPPGDVAILALLLVPLLTEAPGA